jgi:uncharacterized protein (TIGR02453 family)
MAQVKDNNPFGPGSLKFLRALARNNDRGWFEAHRDDYEGEVREPALMFIRIMARHVHRISTHLRASDKRAGGSLMRIHRDVRFSKNKAPYKTNVGIQFRHEAGKDVHAPGLYFHVEPGRCFLGCGMWRPDADALRAVREAIVEDPKGWKRVRDGKRFGEGWELGGESLKRPPRGYPDDHPMLDDLKRKDHIAFCELTDKQVVAADLIDRVAEQYRRAAPYLRWQAAALDLAF